MWPFSSSAEDAEAEAEPEPEPEPETEVVEVEEEITREVEHPAVRLRWDGGEDDLREEVVEGYAIEHRESGLAFQEVGHRARVRSPHYGVTAHIELDYRDARFVPYKHLLEWEIIEREEHEFAETVTYTEEQEVGDD